MFTLPSFLDRMKQEYSELEDDRTFLDYEIRDSRLQNKMLKIALSKQHNQCEEINQMNQTTKDEINNLTMIKANKTITDVPQKGDKHQS